MSSATAERQGRVEEAIAYGFLAALGGYFFLMSFGYGLLKDGGRVGPGLLPAVAGGLLMVMSLVRLVFFVKGRAIPHDRGLAEVAATVVPDDATPDGARADAADDEGGDIFGRTAAQRGRQLQVVLGALVVAVLLVPFVGFLLAFFVLSLFISAYVERRPWLPSLVIALASVAVVHAVFVVFLSVPLPTGFLGLGG